MFTRIIAAIVAATFLSTTIVPPSMAQIFNVNLPVAGTMVTASPAYVPVLIKGMTLHADEPMRFDFIIDSGHSVLENEEFRAESEQLIRYFMAAMTTPTNDLWVNLSPNEPDRIIPDELAKTELGRDLLAQDYMLKQLTASLMYPEDELGAEFWERVYAKAERMYGTADVPTETFHKVWILPESASVYEYGDTVYIVNSRLKVMMEDDYLSLEGIHGETAPTQRATSAEDLSTEIMREVILPEIEREVNEGENFAQLRQIYHSLILAKWYKEAARDSLLGRMYVDQGKVSGIDGIDEAAKEEIYRQYMAAYKAGVYDYLKDEYDAASQQVIPRKYFSGGFRDGDMAMLNTFNAAEIRASKVGDHTVVVADLMPNEAQGDMAMISSRREKVVVVNSDPDPMAMGEIGSIEEGLPEGARIISVTQQGDPVNVLPDMGNMAFRTETAYKVVYEVDVGEQADSAQLAQSAPFLAGVGMGYQPDNAMIDPLILGLAAGGVVIVAAGIGLGVHLTKKYNTPKADFLRFHKMFLKIANTRNPTDGDKAKYEDLRKKLIGHGTAVLPDLLDMIYQSDFTQPNIPYEDIILEVVLKTNQGYDTLVKMARDARKDVRVNALKVLVRTSDLRALDVMIEAVKDRDRDIHRIGLYGFVTFNRVEAIEPLKSVLTPEQIEHHHIIFDKLRLSEGITERDPVVRDKLVFQRYEDERKKGDNAMLNNRQLLALIEGRFSEIGKTNVPRSELTSLLDKARDILASGYNFKVYYDPERRENIYEDGGGDDMHDWVKTTDGGGFVHFKDAEERKVIDVKVTPEKYGVYKGELLTDALRAEYGVDDNAMLSETAPILAGVGMDFQPDMAMISHILEDTIIVETILGIGTGVLLTYGYTKSKINFYRFLWLDHKIMSGENVDNTVHEKHNRLKLALKKSGDTVIADIMRLLKYQDFFNPGNPFKEILIGIYLNSRKGIPQLVRKARSSNQQERINAIRLLALTSDLRALDVLIESIAHKDSHTKTTAILSFYQYNRYEAYEPLVATLTESEREKYSYILERILAAKGIETDDPLERGVILRHRLEGQEAADNAMLNPVGGIDMNTIQMEREGAVDIQFDPAVATPMLQQNINGLTPVIINMIPLPSIMPLLGFDDTTEPETQISRLNDTYLADDPFAYSE